MEYRAIIFYFSLFLSILCVAEIYVRMKGIGVKEQKVRGEVVPDEPKLAPAIVLLVTALVTSVLTLPR